VRVLYAAVKANPGRAHGPFAIKRGETIPAICGDGYHPTVRADLAGYEVDVGEVDECHHAVFPIVTKPRSTMLTSIDRLCLDQEEAPLAKVRVEAGTGLAIAECAFKVSKGALHLIVFRQTV
jgi:hypothetical protein